MILLALLLLFILIFASLALTWDRTGGLMPRELLRSLGQVGIFIGLLAAWMGLPFLPALIMVDGRLAAGLGLLSFLFWAALTGRYWQGLIYWMDGLALFQGEGTPVRTGKNPNQAKASR